MTAATLARRFGVVTLTVGAFIVSGALLALVEQGPAHAAPTPEFTLAFDGLEPGVPQTRSDSFVLDRDATLIGFAWLERTGVMTDATLSIEVCDAASTCLDPATLSSGVAMVAGPVVVTVTTELDAAAPPGAAGSVVGRLSFVADDELASTGADPLPWLAVGAAAVALGVLVVAFVERRRGPRRGHGEQLP
jgi:hypothetical protein